MMKQPRDARRIEGIEFPPDWDRSSIGNVADLRGESVDPMQFASLPCVGLEHLLPGENRVRRFGSANEVRSLKNRFHRNDVLYGKLRPYLDKGGLATFDGMCSTDILVLVPKPGLVDSAFLSFLIHTKEFLEHTRKTTSGVNHPRTSWDSIRKFTTAIPSVTEQKKIAAVLSTFQEAQEKTEAVISALKELKKAMMRHVFTHGPVPVSEVDKVRLKETEIGVMPEDWRVAPVESLMESVRYGSSMRSAEGEGGVPILGIKNVVNGVVDIRNLNSVELTTGERERLSLRAGDILYVRTNATKENLGKCAIYRNAPSEAVFASYLIRVRTKEIIVPDFLYYFSNTHYGRQQLSGRANEAADGKYNINTQTIKRMMVPLPDLSTQKSVVGALSSIDCSIDSERMSSVSLKTLFGSMLAGLMVGKLRVNDLEVST
jgi:type I restriction enzyme S subunit